MKTTNQPTDSLQYSWDVVKDYKDILLFLRIVYSFFPPIIQRQGPSFHFYTATARRHDIL